MCSVERGFIYKVRFFELEGLGFRVCSSGGCEGFRTLGSGPEGGRTSRPSSSLAGSANDACHCSKWSMVMKCCRCCCFTKKPLRESACLLCGV